jgi:hypothetical protein
VVKNFTTFYIAVAVAIVIVLAWCLSAITSSVVAPQRPRAHARAAGGGPTAVVRPIVKKAVVSKPIALWTQVPRPSKPTSVSIDARAYPNAAWGKCRLSTDCGAVLSACGLPMAVHNAFKPRMLALQATAAKLMRCPRPRVGRPTFKVTDPTALVARCRESKCVAEYKGAAFDWRGVAVATAPAGGPATAKGGAPARGK